MMQTDSREFEESFIGSMLIDPSMVISVDLLPHHFFMQLLGKVWGLMQKLSHEKKSIDYLIVAKMLSIEEGYLIQLINKTPSSMHYQTYASEIKEYSTKRHMLDMAGKLANFANSDTPAEDGIVSVINELAAVSQPKGGAKPIAEFTSKLYDEIINLKAHPKDLYGLKTKIAGFDKITYGLQRKETFILSGEPGIGKSILSFQMAFGMQAEQPGAIYEMEMSANAAIRRQLSTVSKIPAHELRTGRFADANWDSLLAAIQAIAESNIFLSDGTHWSTSSIRADLSRLKKQHDIGWVVIDYMNLLADKYGNDNNDRTTHISKQLHHIAKDLDLAVLIIHSMNKKGMGGSADKENLSGSGSIAYDADQICFMVQEPDNKKFVNLLWDKVREGDGDRMLQLMRVPGFPAFVEKASPRQEQELEYWQK